LNWNSKSTLKTLLIGLFFGGIIPQVWALDLVRNPFLQQGSPDAITLVWQTDVEADGWIQYGEVLAEQSQSSDVAAAATNHAVTISGLLPGTRYYYSVHSTDGVLVEAHKEYYFETAPESGSKGPVRISVVGDSGGSPWNSKVSVRDALIGYANDHRINVFLHLGNMSNVEGSEQDFQSHFFDVYTNILRNTVSWPTMGEFEAVAANADEESGPYFETFTLPSQGEAGGVPSGTEAYYSFDYANIHVIVLESNQSSREADGPMLTWLKEDLDATQQDWIIATWHHSPYTMGSYNSDVETSPTEMREKVLPILEAGGVDLVLAGSSHIYERSFLVNGAYDTPTTAEGHILGEGDGSITGDGPYIKSTEDQENQGTVYVTAGHGGLDVSKEADHPLMYFVEDHLGSCVIDVVGGLLTLNNIRSDGVVSDTFSIVKEDGLLLAHPVGDKVLEAHHEDMIRWTTVGDIPFIDISYSLNNGNLWIPIAQNAPNTGSHPWIIPAVNTDSARIRVQASDNPEFKTENDLGVSLTTNTSKVIFPYGSDWKYHDQNVEPGSDWSLVGFDDSTWITGAGPFGYDSETDTTLLSEGETRTPTFYFRKTVSFEELPDTVRLTSQLNGGYVAYVNGVEVARKNVESVAFEDWAVLTEFEVEETSKKLGIGIDLGTRNCAELLAAGETEDGLYDVWPEGPDGVELSVYCDMTTDGGGWTRVFFHDVSDGYFASNDDAHARNQDDPLAKRYSILNRLSLFQSSDETYKLRINWPNDLEGRNIWRQSSHPTTAPIQGYEAIEVEFTTQYWGGLELSTSGSTYVDGSVQHGNWFYSVGSKAVWNGGIPAHGPAAQRVALWVKPDTLAPFEVGVPFEGEGNVLAIMVKQGDTELNHVSFDAQMVGYTEIKTPNTPPEFPPLDEQKVYVGVEFTLQLDATDADEDSLVFVAPTLPEGAHLDFQTGIFTWTPSEEQFGLQGIKFTVADLRGASKWQTVIFNISKDTPPDEDAGAPVDDAGSPEETTTTDDVAAAVDVAPEDTAPAPSGGGGCVTGRGAAQTASFWLLVGLLGTAVLRRRTHQRLNG
jgi:hypothetical protein